MCLSYSEKGGFFQPGVMNFIHIIQLAYGIMGIVAYIIVFCTMRALKSTLSRSFCVIYVLTSTIVSYLICFRCKFKLYCTYTYTFVCSMKFGKQCAE